jgi:hypothetical protein
MSFTTTNLASSFTVIGILLTALGTYMTHAENQKKENLSHIKKNEKINSLKPYIDTRVYSIINDCAALRYSIYAAFAQYPKSSGLYPEEEFAKPDELKEMLNSIDHWKWAPARLLPNQGKFWDDFIYEKILSTTKAIDDVIKKSNFTSTKLVTDLGNLENLKLFSLSEKLFKSHQIKLRWFVTQMNLGKKPEVKGSLAGYEHALLEYFSFIEKFEKEHYVFSTIKNSRKYTD